MRPSKNNIITFGIILSTILLAAIAVFTAFRLYQLRNEPIAPNAPGSKPAAEGNCNNEANDLVLIDYIHIDDSIVTAVVRNRSFSCSYRINMASYKVFGPEYETQVLFDTFADDPGVEVGPGQEQRMEVTIDTSCQSQSDVFWGPIIQSFASGDRYSWPVDRLIESRHNWIAYCTGSSPSPTPTKSPSPTPTRTPTSTPTASPSPTPTKSPSPTPTKSPTPSPTSTPTGSPTTTPTSTPTIGMCKELFFTLTGATSTPTPTNTPTSSPSATPTTTPNGTTTPKPSTTPSPTPTLTQSPTSTPRITVNPTTTPTASLPNAGVSFPTIMGLGAATLLLLFAFVIAL